MLRKVKGIVSEWKLDMDHEVYAVNGHRYYDQKEPLPWLVIVVEMLVCRVWARVVLQRICRIKGHEWVDTGYGVPDSGVDSGYCERCHDSHYIRLY